MKTNVIVPMVLLTLLGLGGAGCNRKPAPPDAPPQPAAKPAADPTLLAFADTFARFAQDCATSARDAAGELAEHTPLSKDKK